MSKYLIFKKGLLLSITTWLLISFNSFCTAQPYGLQPDLVMTILHTNDLHAHDEPFLERGRSTGGLSRLGHLIKLIRSKTDNVLTIDAGDIFQGTPFFQFYHGAVEVALLNLIGYDIYTPGNHEFDDGPENLARQLAAAKFDIISANLDAGAVPELARLLKPSVIKTIDGRKVAFVGAICPDLEQISLTAGKVHIKDASDNWIKPVKQEVNRLVSLGVCRIILVTHVGLDHDKQLAEAIPEVDVIVGGHSHTRLARPVTVFHKDGTQTIIVQTGCYGRALGKLKLAFDGEGHLMPGYVNYHLININERIFDDPEITAYLESKDAPVRRLRATTVGTAAAAFDNRFSRYPWDSPIGNLVCDALADAGTAYGATISFENRGGIRQCLEQGPISQEEIEEILPFNNHLTMATVSGKTILNALEHATGKGLGGRFMDVHGLKFAYDQGKPEGSRIVFAMTEDGGGRWHNIDAGKPYKIAINDYNFNSGEGYDFAGARDKVPGKDTLATIVSAYLKKIGQVSPTGPGRIVPVTDNLAFVLKHGGRQVLHVQCGVPGARLTLATGSEPGIDSLDGRIPVPLSHAHLAAGGIRADESGEYDFVLPVSRIKQKDPGLKQQGMELKQDPLNPAVDKWAAVIVQMPGKGAAAKIKISYPVSLAGQSK